MEDTNPYDNDKKKLAAQRDADFDSTTNRYSSTTRMNRLGFTAPHDDPDELNKVSKKPPSTHYAPSSGKLHLVERRRFITEEVADEDVATPITDNSTAGTGLEGTVSISSWEANFPEIDERFESIVVEPAVAPGAFPVAGAHSSPDSDDFTVTDQDSMVQPLPKIPVTAHAVDEDEENLMRQELHDLRAMVHHAVVANVVTRGESQQEEQNNVSVMAEEDEERAVDIDNDQQHDTIEANGGTKIRRNVLIVAGLLVLFAIILGIAVPLALKKDSPTLWTQIGNDLVGEADGDWFGYSVALSGDGGFLAVGSPHNDASGEQSGSVRVYQQPSDERTTWTKLGGDIDGANAHDFFGCSVSLSNSGTVLAVGAYGNDSNGGRSGQVRVFESVNNEWSPIGDPINGQGENDRFGWSVALLADGTIVAAGADGGAYTLVYQLQNGNWTLLGTEIPGNSYSVSLSHDGTVLAVGDSGWDQVRVYRFVNNDWTIIDSAITGSGGFGFSVSLSANGRIVAIGAPENDGTDSFDSYRGVVYVYQNVNDEWNRVGSILYGATEDDKFGRSVCLSDDGTVLAVGAISNDSSGRLSGQVRVFQLVDDEWTLIGNPVNGRGEQDYFGKSVALSADGTIVAAGAPEDSPGPGYALVHRFEPRNAN